MKELKCYAIFKDGKMTFYIAKNRVTCIKEFVVQMYSYYAVENPKEYWKMLKGLGFTCEQILISKK
jgi:hypothetical protein